MTTTLESSAAEYKRNRPVGYCCNQAITLETCQASMSAIAMLCQLLQKFRADHWLLATALRRDFENEAATAAGEATRISTTE